MIDSGGESELQTTGGYKRLCCVHGKTLNSFKAPLQKYKMGNKWLLYLRTIFHGISKEWKIFAS